MLTLVLLAENLRLQVIVDGPARLLLRYAVNVPTAQGNIDCVHLNNFTIRKYFLAARGGEQRRARVCLCMVQH